MMPAKLRRLAAHLEATFWLRPTLAVLAGAAVVAILLLADPTGRLDWLPAPPAAAVAAILSPLAASALTITTVAFSVVMVVFTLAAGNASPRALRELMADREMQNGLATFLGVLAFAIAGQVAVGTDAAGSAALAALAVLAMAASLVLIGAFIALMHHVSELMKLGRVIDRLHRAAGEAISGMLAGADETAPCPSWPAPPLVPLGAKEPGYVVDIDVAMLAELAAEHDLRLEITVRVGDFASAIVPLLRLSSAPRDPEALDALRGAFDIAAERDTDSDPRQGLELLGEIGCRALSPAVNDPITATVCLDHLGDLLAGPAGLVPGRWPQGGHPDGRISRPVIGFAQLLDTGMPLIARSGCGFLVVVARVLEVLARLDEIADPAHRPAIRGLAEETSERARRQLSSEPEQRLLQSLRRPPLPD